MWGWSFRPYVSVAKRRRLAARQIARLTKGGRKVSPVCLDGKAIARTFWGKAWCDNLESYSDYANRLPRGRSYVRNGSVLDLQVEHGKVTGMVQGSSLYKQTIGIKPLKPAHWKRIKSECSGKIDSLIELLQGRLSDAVMRVITRRGNGLFPQPSEIKLACSCPDWAEMCKHVAAVLYGVGARLDEKPELLFHLRGADHLELVEQAGAAALRKTTVAGESKTIKGDELSNIFGIEIAEPAAPPAASRADSVTEPTPNGQTERVSKPSKAAQKSSKSKCQPARKPASEGTFSISAAARGRIIAAQRKRWAAYRATKSG